MPNPTTSNIENLKIHKVPNFSTWKNNYNQTNGIGTDELVIIPPAQLETDIKGWVPSASDTDPIIDGTADAGSATTWARADHVHPTDTSRAPTNHSTTTWQDATTYGIGTNNQWGHLKLSDEVNSMSDSSLGAIAATPYAVKRAYDLANGKQAKITVNGILKGDGEGGITAAVAGNDYLAPGGNDLVYYDSEHSEPIRVLGEDWLGLSDGMQSFTSISYSGNYSYIPRMAKKNNNEVGMLITYGSSTSDYYYRSYKSTDNGLTWDLVKNNITFTDNTSYRIPYFQSFTCANGKYIANYLSRIWVSDNLSDWIYLDCTLNGTVPDRIYVEFLNGYYYIGGFVGSNVQYYKCLEADFPTSSRTWNLATTYNIGPSSKQGVAMLGQANDYIFYGCIPSGASNYRLFAFNSVESTNGNYQAHCIDLGDNYYSGLVNIMYDSTSGNYIGVMRRSKNGSGTRFIIFSQTDLANSSQSSPFSCSFSDLVDTRIDKDEKCVIIGEYCYFISETNYNIYKTRISNFLNPNVEGTFCRTGPAKNLIYVNGKLLSLIGVSTTSSVYITMSFNDTQTFACLTDSQSNPLLISLDPISFNTPICSGKTGTYSGAGTYGSSNKNSLTFDFTPLYVMVYPSNSPVYPDSNNSRWKNGFIWTPGIASENVGEGVITFSLLNKTLSWYSTSAAYQLNTSNTTYYYIAFGITNVLTPNT